MRRAAVVLLVVIVFAPAGQAADSESKPKEAGRAVVAELQRYAHDARDLATTPLRWDRTRWKRFGAGVTAVAIVYAADPELENAFQRNRSSFTDRFAKEITPWGANRALKISGLMILGGAIAGNPQVRDAGRDSLESQFWAAGIVTPTLKRAFGRARPIQDEGARSFHPLDSHYQSFPSGHATNSWAFATAVAGHFDGWVVPTIVYTMAAGVSLSRVNDRAHFPSDVLAGALIGHAVGKGIVARHHTARTVWIVTPIVIDRGAGIVVHVIVR